MRQASQAAAQNSVRMQTLEAYLDALASARPTPGGGSAAAVSGALGAALAAMVARITAGSPRFAARAEEASAIAAGADGLRAALLDARVRDEAAFAAVVAAQALPRLSDAEKAARTEALQHALLGAAEAPLETARLALAVLQAADDALALGNANLAGDGGCAAELAAAALACAAYNVRANHPYMKDEARVEAQRSALASLEAESAPVLARIRAGF